MRLYGVFYYFTRRAYYAKNKISGIYFHSYHFRLLHLNTRYILSRWNGSSDSSAHSSLPAKHPNTSYSAICSHLRTREMKLKSNTKWNSRDSRNNCTRFQDLYHNQKTLYYLLFNKKRAISRPLTFQIFTLW